MKEQKKATEYKGNGYGWIKMHRSEIVEELITEHRNAWALLCLLAKRAWRGPLQNRHFCSAGEAFIGDFRACGFTKKEYRCAKSVLERYGLCTFRGTNKGTIAKLISAEVFDINIDEAKADGPQQGTQGAPEGHSEGTQGASEGAPEGHTEGIRGATNKKLRSEELKKERKEEDNTTTTGSGGDAPPSEADTGADAPEDLPPGTGIPDAEEKEQSPGQKAVLLSKDLTEYLKNVQQLKQTPVFTQQTLTEAKEFFQRNVDYRYWDVIAICALGIKLARENAAPQQGNDPYFYARRFAGKANRLFDRNADGDLILSKIELEVKYAPDGKHSFEWADKLIQGELKRAAKLIREQRQHRN